jgi:hypothetical protein
MIILDQVPVSTIEEIEVNVQIFLVQNKASEQEK